MIPKGGFSFKGIGETFRGIGDKFTKKKDSNEECNKVGSQLVKLHAQAASVFRISDDRKATAKIGKLQEKLNAVSNKIIALEGLGLLSKTDATVLQKKYESISRILPKRQVI